MIDINELRQSLGAVQPEEVAELLARLEAAEKERDALRAKIETTEKQEPVAWCDTDETGPFVEGRLVLKNHAYSTRHSTSPPAHSPPRKRLRTLI